MLTKTEEASVSEDNESSQTMRCVSVKILTFSELKVISHVEHIAIWPCVPKCWSVLLTATMSSFFVKIMAHIPTWFTTIAVYRNIQQNRVLPWIVFHFAIAFVSAPGSWVFCVPQPSFDVIRYDMMHFSKVRILFWFHPSLVSLTHGLHFELVFQKWKTVCSVCL